MKRSSSLTELPHELLVRILDHLGDSHICGIGYELHYPRDTYNALCLTSRTIYNAASPFRYRSFENYYDAGPNLDWLRRLCIDPKFAKQVHRLKLHANLDFSLTRLRDEDLDLFAYKLSERLRHDRVTYYEIAYALARGCYAARLIVAMTAATSVHSLNLDHEVMRLSQHWSRETDCSHCKVKVFFKWFTILFSDQGFRDEHKALTRAYMCIFASYRTVLPFLRLPALQELHAQGLEADESGPSIEGMPSTTLEEIHLDWAQLDTTALEDIIQSTTVLKILSVVWDEGAPGIVDLPKILPALRQHENRLEHLELSNAMMNGAAFLTGPDCGSLRTFKCLKVLRVDEGFLRGQAGWHETSIQCVLPVSLEALAIFTNDRGRQLGSLLQAVMRCQLSRLQNLCVVLGGIPFGWIETDWLPTHESDIARFEYETFLVKDSLVFKCPEARLLLSGLGITSYEDDLEIPLMIRHSLPLSANKDGSLFVRGADNHQPLNWDQLDAWIEEEHASLASEGSEE